MCQNFSDLYVDEFLLKLQSVQRAKSSVKNIFEFLTINFEVSISVVKSQMEDC